MRKISSCGESHPAARNVFTRARNISPFWRRNGALLSTNGIAPFGGSFDEAHQNGGDSTRSDCSGSSQRVHRQRSRAARHGRGRQRREWGERGVRSGRASLCRAAAQSVRSAAAVAAAARWATLPAAQRAARGPRAASQTPAVTWVTASTPTARAASMSRPSAYTPEMGLRRGDLAQSLHGQRLPSFAGELLGLSQHAHEITSADSLGRKCRIGARVRAHARQLSQTGGLQARRSHGHRPSQLLRRELQGSQRQDARCGDGLGQRRHADAGRHSCTDTGRQHGRRTASPTVDPSGQGDHRRG